MLLEGLQRLLFFIPVLFFIYLGTGIMLLTLLTAIQRYCAGRYEFTACHRITPLDLLTQ